MPKVMARQRCRPSPALSLSLSLSLSLFPEKCTSCVVSIWCSFSSPSPSPSHCPLIWCLPKRCLRCCWSQQTISPTNGNGGDSSADGSGNADRPLTAANQCLSLSLSPNRAIKWWMLPFCSCRLLLLLLLWLPSDLQCTGNVIYTTTTSISIWIAATLPKETSSTLLP